MSRTAKCQFWAAVLSVAVVFAPHFPYPGIGHVVPDGDAYTWVPQAL